MSAACSEAWWIPSPWRVSPSSKSTTRAWVGAEETAWWSWGWEDENTGNGGGTDDSSDSCCDDFGEISVFVGRGGGFVDEDEDDDDDEEEEDEDDSNEEGDADKMRGFVVSLATVRLIEAGCFNSFISSSESESEYATNREGSILARLGSGSSISLWRCFAKASKDAKDIA